MELFKGYQSLEVVSDLEYSTLYKGFSTVSRTNVMIKTIKDNYISSKLINSIRHEFNQLNSYEGSEILRPIALEIDGHKPYVLYEYFPCITLRDYMLINKKIDVGDFLSIAIRLTSELVNLNYHQIVHKNINPSTILVNPSSHDIKLTGLQYADIGSNGTHSYLPLSETDIDFAYISPEQTERMNRKVDARTDLYSLGLIFYEMLAGHLPFVEKTRFDWIHAHLTKQPPTLAEINQSIPHNLSNIIMKLLNKSPIERYRSPLGLREDLISCQILSKNNYLPLFKVGKNDPYLNIESTNNRIYGRKEEIERLESICREQKDRKSKLVLITGESGTGKSALVDEVKQQFTKEQAFFIQGKFDLLIKQNPYSAFLAAFKMLLKQILTEDEAIIKKWSEKIEKELGSNLSAIINVLPELKWLVEEETEKFVITSENAQTHFYYSFQQLVRIFAHQNRPLIIFLDDLQWADSASLGLLEYLLSNHDTHSLVVIGAYRESEVTKEHILTETILHIEKEIMVHHIQLNLLSKDTLVEWLNTYFLKNIDTVQPLVSTIYSITQGNPFFIKQLLRSFYEKHIVYFEQKSGTWMMDSGKLYEATIHEDVVGYLVNRVKQLPVLTQLLLQIAACIGNQFDLRMLSKLSNQTVIETSPMIQYAVEFGLLIPLNEGENKTRLVQDQDDIPQNKYRFIHDRVQQAIYLMLTEKEKSTIHLKIGKRLLNESNKLEESNLIDTVYHLNMTRHTLQREEMINLATLNVEAGLFSIQTAAFQAALSYFTIAYDLLGEEWDNHYDLTFKLFTGMGEAQYLNNQFSLSENSFNKLLKQAKTKVEKLSIYHLKITLYTHMHRVEEAVEAGLAALQLYNQRFTRKPNKLQVAKEILLVKLAFIGKEPSDILKLPNMDKHEDQLILKTLISLNGPSYHVDQNLSTIFMLRAMRMTIKHGLTDVSPLVFNNYALILSAGLKDYKQSYEFGMLALSYAEEKGIVGLKGRVNFVFGSFVNHWRNHLNESVTYLENSQKDCIQAGNIHVAGASSSFIVIAHFLKGSRLDVLKQVIQKQKSFIEDIQYPISAGFMDEIQEWVDYLTDDKTKKWLFKKIIDDDSAKIIHYTLRLKMAYLFDKDDFATQVLQELSPLVNNRLTLVIAPEFYFYEALCLLRFVRKGNYRTYSKKDIFKKVKRDLRQLEIYASMSPINYESKTMLVKAELASILGKVEEAVQCFDEAIRSGEKYQFLHTIAICNEAAGRFYVDHKRHKIASVYLKDAYDGFLNWGATTKADQILTNFETYFNRYEKVSFVPVEDNRHPEQYDLNAVYKAAQIISSEMKLQQLLEKVLQITMEHAGATKGTILFKEEDELTIAVQANSEFYDENDFSDKIVQYVNKTGEIVHLDHAYQNGLFQTDDYVVRTKAKSIISLPIYHSLKLVGILYLENNHLTHVFTKERIKFIRLLITQAAISIENAMLYKHLEDKVKERTIELEDVNQTLAETNNYLAKSEEMRRELLSNISHDLRAPIASVQGYMEAILDGLANTEEKRNEYIRNSILRIKGLNVLINDLFDLTQLEAGNLSFSYDYVPIDQLLENIKNQFIHEVARKNLTLELHLGGQKLFPLVEIDIERIGQVFANLLTNAIKHTTAGGIQLGVEIEEDAVLISCRDTGFGINKEDLPYIFERNFTRTNHSSRKGNGLGLSICKEIIKCHNGEIWAESELGKGTNIYIHLPTVRVEEEAMLI